MPNSGTAILILGRDLQYVKKFNKFDNIFLKNSVFVSRKLRTTGLDGIYSWRKFTLWPGFPHDAFIESLSIATFHRPAEIQGLLRTLLESSVGLRPKWKKFWSNRMGTYLHVVKNKEQRLGR